MDKKNMTMTLNALIILFLGLLIITPIEEIHAQDHQKGNTKIQESAWLDATDQEIFGTNALHKESAFDQSVKLQAIIDQAMTQTNKVYIPAGIYILDENVTLRSGLKLKGDQSAPTIFKNTTSKNVTLSDEDYQTSHNIELSQLFFDGIGIFTRRSNSIVIKDNVFYHPVSLYPINLQASNGATIQNNIFMRDHEHSTPDTENRAIYIGGFATSGIYEYMKNVRINDNLFGLRINELDAIKSFSNEAIVQTINRLQSALQSQEIVLAHNDQNYLSCGVNSYNNTKNVLIKDNFFQQMYENEDRFGVVGDHAIYLRGSQSVQVVGNHVRGLHNGPYGGFKFKSGRDITIMNNYLRNTGLILYETPEFGLGDSFAQGTVAELSNFLVANNVFDFKEWQDRYAIGMEYNRHTGIDNVFNGVFIDNHFVNYHNIPADRRRELLIMNGAREGFKGASTFVSGNTRDDTADRVLNVEYWRSEDYQQMPVSWTDLIDPTVYEQYKDVRIPVSNTFPIGLEVELILGKSYDPFDFVSQTHDSDDEKPEITLINPEVLTKVGQHQLELLLTYANGREVRVFSTVTVVSQSSDETGSNTPTNNVKTQGQITFLPNSEELIVIPPETSPEVTIPPEIPGGTGPLSIMKAISMDFGPQVISTKNQTYQMKAEMADLEDGTGQVPYVSFAQVQDVRGTNAGWDLQVSLSDFTSTTQNGVLTGAEIEFLDSRIQYEGSTTENTPTAHEAGLKLLPNGAAQSVMTAAQGQGAGASSVIWGNQSDLNAQFANEEVEVVENSAIQLSIPGSTAKDATRYTSTLTWELVMIPDLNELLSN
ncbi:cell wall surface anchor family protein (plasmid) [Enterococcus mundtii]|uniref:Cell wall surface anchor family protein n=1 Tax=Enterococcus mundtii TaxID=53346 RepID=A0AAI8RCB6_ENTMU|nr:cell wall surface anchor family protein [Enterococcus mundtii]